MSVTATRVRARPFAAYWVATSVSMLGSGVTLVAVPLLAAQQLGAGAAGVGMLRALELAPYAALALLVGRLADQVQPLWLMVAADAVRAVVLVTVVACAATGALTLPALGAAVLVVGALTVTYDVAQFTLLPAIVPPEHRVEANAAIELARGGAFTLGPGLGGLVVAALRAGPAILVDAVSYVLSAGLLLTLRGRRLERPRTGRVSVRDGVRFAAGHPLLRPLTLYLGVNNACTQALVTGLVAYLSVGRPRGAGLVGLAVGGYGLGFLLGAVAAPAVIRRFGTPGSVVGSSLLSATGAGVVAVGAAMQSGPMTVTAAVVGAVGVGVAGPIFNVPSVTLRLAVTPAELLGRVTAVVKLVSQGGLPVGAFAGGLLVAGLPPVVAFGTIAGVSLLATLLLVGLPSEVG